MGTGREGTREEELPSLVLFAQSLAQPPVPWIPEAAVAKGHIPGTLGLGEL